MRALIIDGEELFRLTLNEIISVSGPFTSIFHAPTLLKASSLKRQTNNVDLIFIHPKSIDRDEAESIAEIRKGFPTSIVLCFDARKQIQKSSNVYFVPRAITAKNLIEMIRQIFNLSPVLRSGQQPSFSAKILSAIHDENKEIEAKNTKDDLSLLKKLSKRQYQILLMATEGLPNKEIACRLNIAEGTVKAHMHSLFRALNVTNRTLAVVKFGKMLKETEQKQTSRDHRSIEYQPSAL